VTAPDARHDIEDRADCERLVRAFYGRTLTDPVLGFIFNDVAHLDLEAHVPVITSFWETILLGAHTYAGGAFAKHADLHHKVPLRAGHFERWLFLWRMTVDELFAGPRADEAKSHANRVARAFHERLEGRVSDAAPTAATGLAIATYPATSGGQTPRSGG
jgi:hemoglobin